MKKIAIKIKSTGQVLPAEAGKLDFEIGDWILVETPQCKEVAVVLDDSRLKEEISEGEIQESDIEVIRKLTEKDRQQYEKFKIAAEELIPECQKKINYHHLPMELLDAELSFDEKKLTFY